jgi:hypothetical protein
VFLSANSVAGQTTALGTTTTVVTTAGATLAIAGAYNLATITFGGSTPTIALRNQSYTVVTQTATLITTLQTMAAAPGTTGTDVFTLSGWRTLLMTSQNFKPNFRTVQSQILRSDGNIQDIVRVATDANGNLPFEMHYGDQYSGIFEMLQAAMRTVAVPQVKTTDGGQGSAASSIFTSATFGFTANVQPGDIMYVGAGCSDPGYYRVATVDSNTQVTFEGVNAGAGWSGAPGPSTIPTIRGARMVNGTTLTTGAVELGFLDAPYFVEFLGCGVNGFTLDVTDEQIMKGSFAMIGAGIADGSSTYVTPVATAAPATNVMSNKVNVPAIRLDGANLQVKSVGLTINNGITLETVVANQVATGMNLGSFQLTGTMAAYLSATNMTYFHKLVTATEFKMLIVAADPTTAGKGWSFSMPACKFMDSDIGTQGLNQPQMVSLPWQAKLSAAEGITARFQRFDG